jgi:dihydrofolate reductase
MKVRLVMVSTINGKITNGDDPNIYTWTSLEDSQLFFTLVERSRLIVMGAKTYEAARSKIKLSPDKRRIVATSQPEKYAAEQIKGQLEFSSEAPVELVKRLETIGYKELLLVGGGTLNASFFKENLIDEVHLTIEPVIFRSGKNLFGDETFNATLRLESVKQLNEQGTLHLVYSVIK